MANVRIQTGRIPSPARGLNTRDPLTQMKDADAVTLENWFPEGYRVRVRDGYVEHVPALATGKPVQALMDWRGPAGMVLLAACDGHIYNVTTEGTAGVSLGSGFTSNKWQHACFNSYTIMVNGTDTPQSFNGTALSSAGFTATGLTANNLVYVVPVRQRLFFVEKNTANAWYGSPAAITGPLAKFDLGQIAQYGGNLLAIGSWSVDSGSGAGLSDNVVFVMESGEIIVYKGAYPGDTTWSLVGNYKMAEPVGTRPLVKIGGELVVLTMAGPHPASSAVQDPSVSALDEHPIWGRIRRLFAQEAKLYSGMWGWQACNHNGVVYFNKPAIENSTAGQFVLNSVVGAWCVYSGINAQSWCSFDGQAYFGGSDGVIYRIGGATDNGNAIVARAKTSFSGLGDPVKIKRVTLVRPILEFDGRIDCTIAVDVDYSTRALPMNLNKFTVQGSGANWDDAVWDVDYWGDDPNALGDWCSTGGIGRAFAVRFELSTTAGSVYWYASDLRFYKGDAR